MTVWRIALSLWVWWLAVLAPWAARAGGQAAAPRLCIEYLPGLVYEEQPLAVCVRVEAVGAASGAVRVAAALRDAAGRVLASDGAQGAPKPQAPWRHHSTLSAPRGSPAELELLLTKASGADLLAKLSVRLLSAREPLPSLRVKGMRLADDAGRPVVLRVEHRVRKPEDTWPLFRWLRRRLYGDRWAFRRVLVVGDDLGAPRDGYLARVAAGGRGFAVSTVAVPSAPRRPGPPVLRAVAALTAARLERAPDLAVLSLGHRDGDYGTDVIQFGRALERIVQELERRGCGQFVILAPVGPRHLRERLAPYGEAAERVAFAYRARFVDLSGRLREEHWSGEGAGRRLLLRLPNPKGHQALADALGRYLRKIRR